MKSVLRNVILGMASAGFAASIGSASAQTADPAVGTWKLNIEKSRFAGPPPKSQTAKFEPAGKAVKFINEGVNANGSPISIEWTADYDGKDYPIKGNPAADAVSLKRVNARSVIQTNKKGGEAVTTVTREVSADGRTMTSTIAATNTLVYDASPGSAASRQADPAIGTWNLNVAKSRIGGPAPRSQTARIDAAGKGIKVTTEGINAAGSATATEYTADFDGRDYPVKGSTLSDTVSQKRIDAHTVEQTWKKGGEVVGRWTRRVSKDGRTMTISATGYSKSVWEKQ